MDKFIREIEKNFFYNNAAVIELILVLIFSDPISKDMVVFFTESELFKRKYSSVYRVLKSYFCSRNANGDQKISLRRKECRKIKKYLTTLYTKNRKRNIYALDTTNHYRFCASKGVDRINVRYRCWSNIRCLFLW